MAQPAAATKQSAQTPAEEKPSAKETEALRNEILTELTQIKRSGEIRRDVLAGRYRIRVNSPIPTLSHHISKAFEAEDEQMPERQIYALVCAPELPQRGKVLRELQPRTLPNFANAIASGPVDLSGTFNSRRMVLILERPMGKSLAQIMQERGRPLPDSFIIEHIIIPIDTVLAEFETLGYSHGRIHPGNLYFGDKLMVGECVSEPCGYSQPFAFEPIERAQAHAAGKGEGSTAQDYYALGVLVAYLRAGTLIFYKSHSLATHLKSVTQDGSFNALTHRMEMSETITDLLCGTLNDNAAERWAMAQMKSWIKGRHFNMASPMIPPVGSRPFHVDNDTYSNFRSLAQGLYEHWDKVANMLKDQSLVRWIELSARRRDIGDTIRRSINSLSATTLKPGSNNDELIARCLTILDPQAPMRIREACCHLDGLGSMVAEFLRTNEMQNLDNALDIIKQGLPNIWADVYKKHDEHMSMEISTALWSLDRMRLVLRGKGSGYGLQRALYDLNPDLSCLSPLFAGNYVGSVRDFMVVLERMAPDKARTSSLTEAHLIAFLASKLNIMRELRVIEFGYFPPFAKHPGIIALRLLMQAQETIGNPKLPAITQWVAVEVLPAMELFHSKTLRDQLQRGIKQFANDGYLHPLFDFLNQKVFVESDQGGFVKAHEKYHGMSYEITVLQSKLLMMNRARERGAQAAKTISYFALLASLLLMLHRYV